MKRGAAKRAGGMALMAVLIALILLSAAAVGLVSMVDTGSLVQGNLAFRQATVAAADHGVEDAIAWLQASHGGIQLFQDAPAAGYYASSQEGLDAPAHGSGSARRLVDWDEDGCAGAAAASYVACLQPGPENSYQGYRVRYLIARMCDAPGDPGLLASDCATPVAAVDSATVQRGELSYGSVLRTGGSVNPYYRIVVRAEGPRHTYSYTESYVHF